MQVKEALLALNKERPGGRLQTMLGLVVPVGAVIAALLVGAILLLMIGVNPLEAYWYLIFDNFSNIYSITEVIIKATPLILSGLAFTFAYRSGLFNIGAEGQMFVGAIAAVIVGLKLSFLPSPLVIFLSLVAAMAAGAIWGGIPGILKSRFGSSEIIITIMLNYVAIHLLSYLVDKPLREASGIYPQTDLIGESAFLPILITNTRFHLGVLIAIAFALLVYIVLWRTPFGYQVRAVGFNPDAAEYAGVNVKWNMILALAISGALAGTAGFTEVNGIHHRLLDNFSRNVGFDGIAVALLGRTTSLGVIISALLFGLLQVGANAMQRGVGVPANIVYVIQALVILFILGGAVLNPLINKHLKKKEVA